MVNTMYVWSDICHCFQGSRFTPFVAPLVSKTQAQSYVMSACWCEGCIEGCTHIGVLRHCIGWDLAQEMTRQT
jgi:hypothetical protein